MGRYFNQTDEEKAFARNTQLFCLVIYDVVSNKRRLKLAKLLQGYGVRVQRSCFEMSLTRPQYRELLSILEDFYEVDEGDDIVVYVISEKDKVVFSSRPASEFLGDYVFL